MTATIDAPTSVPTEFTRDVAFTILETERAEGGDGLTFEGYAAVFDTPTVIDSWEGNFEEIIARGAFKKTLRERTPVLMFEHGHHPLLGSMPLGVITRASEDTRGLLIRARLSDNWLIEPVRDAIGDGAIDGMSFRFRAIKEEWEQPKRGLPRRTLQEVSVPELGPVVFPAYNGTSAAVRTGLAALVSDEQLRTALLQVLSTPDAAAPPSTSEGAAADDQPPEGTGRSRSQRQALAWLHLNRG